MNYPPLRGVVFDMDGTLVDSALDFKAMRSEMGFDEHVPILETLRHMPEAERLRCEAILHRHEWAGADRAVPMPGAMEFLAALDRREIPRAVFTRNGRKLTLSVLSRLEMNFEIVVTREDGPAKPDPAELLALCQQWGLEPQEVVMIGDYHYDINAGRNAGTRTVLYTAGQDLSHFPWSTEADMLLHSFHDAEELLFGKS